MIPQDPIVPIDFNPHIEWFEFPKEIFDPKWPFTWEECVRNQDERWDSTADEMAHKYGLRLMPTPRLMFWIAYFTSFVYITFEMWSAYRAAGGHATWPQWRVGVMSSPKCPTITEDEIYIDQWMNPGFRQRNAKHDLFWAWKPLVKKNPVNPWAIELERKDPSEFKHMIGK